MDNCEVLIYKNYPEGSTERRLYDSCYMPFEDYVNKYYINPDLYQWELWKEDVEYAFKHNKMKMEWGEIAKTFNSEEMMGIYSQLKDFPLEEDIKQYISFLGGSGFFKNFNISVINWLNSTNWVNPHKNYDNGRSIIFIANLKYGMNYLRTQLGAMDWWKFLF